MSTTLQAKKEYELTLEGFSGGLNLREEDYCLGADECSEMKNLLWRDGFLASRKGQAYLQSVGLGTGLSMYEGVWHGHVFAHIGTNLYGIRVSDGTVVDLHENIQPVLCPRGFIITSLDA